MGLCLGSESTAEERQARLRSEKIDRVLCECAKQEQNLVKILLLGAAESGKSTLVKQMKIIHSHGFTEEELISFKIHAQTVLSCGRCFDEDYALFPFMSHALRFLWADQGVKLAASRGYEFELNDSAHYFFMNINRITSPEYKPTQTDLLRVRLRTTGVIETQFKINNLVIRLYDVGGQRTERRKWIGCFEDMRAVLFVAALSGYDMNLLEEPAVNRLQESLRLFSSICNNIFFRNTSMILFLNKIDLFQEKILHSGRHLRLYFAQYRGADCDVDSAARFVASQFLSLNRNPAKLIYHHFTTATDTSNIQVVFQVVMDTIIKENLQAVSLL
ncbi:guanine nucleotide binding protein (G protein) alpha v1 isoform X2 [Chiloscyllium plagiosum]|uniref:guanine nucleotide binding protein (G protein) alpha v1 isoform X2 n=1 Tax=Chiloscyllium plagiosum TaxID=36176 RepID=UPI001CB7E140|nr:guanine nucleotide binding protein (G protein) alpha v1 isoform X2 [Chiloscyllium plagiosum]